MIMNRYLYALDISMECTGVSIFDIDSFDSICTFSLKTNKSKQHGERLYSQIKILNPYIDKYPPCVVVAERGFSRFNTSTQVIYMVHGIMQVLFRKTPIIYYPPKKVKLIVSGKGDATKKKLEEIIREKYPHLTFSNNDESDAFSVGVAHLISQYGMPWDIPTTPKKTRKKKTTKKEG